MSADPFDRLPGNLESGLVALEIGHVLASGGTVTHGTLPQRALDLFNLLEREGIEWVLVGASAANLYLERPRATMDVDVIVRKKHLRKAKRALASDGVELEETEVHYRGILSREPMRLDVDVIKSQGHELFDVALDRHVRVGGIRVASIESLLALKYLSAISPWRARADRGQDIVDFIRVYKDNREAVDRTLLVDLASRAHEKGTKEFPEFLEAVENDRPISL